MERSLVVVMSTLLLATACGAPDASEEAGPTNQATEDSLLPDGSTIEATDEQIGAVQQALNETIPPNTRGGVSIAATTDRLFAVWTGYSAGKNRILGQTFNNNGQPLAGGGPWVYNTGSLLVENPRVQAAITDGGIRFLIAYEETYSAQDLDIAGILTTDLGAPISEAFTINRDGQFEGSPSVTFINSRYSPRWLVSYSRLDFGACNFPAYTVTTVDFNGSSASPVDIVPKCQQLVSNPVAAFGGVNPRLLFSWSAGEAGSSTSKFAFGDASTLAVSAEQSVNGTSISRKTVAYNDSTGAFAMAWRDKNGSQIDLRSRTFPPGCESLSCADAETSPTAIRTWNSSVTEVTGPVLIPYRAGFSIYGATRNSPTSTQIYWSQIKEHGELNSIFNVSAWIPCAAPNGTIPGVNTRTMDAAVPPGNPSSSRGYLIFDSMCNNTNQVKVAKTGIDYAPGNSQSFSVVGFPASN